MNKRVHQGVFVFVVAFGAAQLVGADHANPLTDVSRTIAAQPGTTPAVAGILDRACRDCHSNNTEWRWYTRVAPVSWLMKYGVTKGRDAINFSEWAAYSPEQRRILLAASCDDVKSGKMPGPYTRLRPETRLSPKDVETICAASRDQEEARR